jgi:hypothetical protein
LSVAIKSWRSFLDLHPAETPGRIQAVFGRTSFALALGSFFLLIEWLYFAALEVRRDAPRWGRTCPVL